MSFFARLFARRPASKPAAETSEGLRAAPAGDCAIWHDISRALDHSPRPSGKKAKVRGFAQSKDVSGEGAKA